MEKTLSTDTSVSSLYRRLGYLQLLITLFLLFTTQWMPGINQEQFPAGMATLAEWIPFLFYGRGVATVLTLYITFLCSVALFFCIQVHLSQVKCTKGFFESIPRLPNLDWSKHPVINFFNHGIFFIILSMMSVWVAIRALDVYVTSYPGHKNDWPETFVAVSKSGDITPINQYYLRDGLVVTQYTAIQNNKDISYCAVGSLELYQNCKSIQANNTDPSRCYLVDRDRLQKKIRKLKQENTSFNFGKSCHLDLGIEYTPFFSVMAIIFLSLGTVGIWVAILWKIKCAAKTEYT
ncbi:MAG: hypothetical protein R3F53_14355 [Gammaproteobacteria bacterium]